MQYYINQRKWKLVQPFLPQKNQLNDKNLPQEYFIDWNENKIHIDHYNENSDKGTILAFHGVAGNGRLLSSVILPLVNAGYEVVCPDFPLFGNTVVFDNQRISYDMWVECGAYLVEHYQKMEKKIILFGLSAGGLLAYQVACKCSKIYGIMASCFLDQRIPIVLEQTAKTPRIGKISRRFLPLANKLLPNLKIPMKLIANTKALVNNDELAQILVQDERGPGSRVTMSFIYSMVNPYLQIEPDEFDKCPVLLVHPENDKWTDVSLSRLFYDRLKCDKSLVMIENAGHFPLEETGLLKMGSTCIDFCQKCYS
jgi:hypothetical protein